MTAREAVWLNRFLAEVLHRPEITVVLHCDNQGAIALAKETQFHPKTKHIAKDHKWVQEAVADNHVTLQYIPTANQVADGLTKPLPKDKFEWFRAAIGVEKVL